MQPTEEQIKEFWEWCGFKVILDQYTEAPTDRWHIPNGETIDGRTWCFQTQVAIDLNNLFKWAVPKLRAIGCRLMLSDKTENSEVVFMGRVYGKQTQGFLDALDTDPALALFWAIWKVF